MSTKRIVHNILRFFPLILVVGVPLILAITNIDPSTHYAGWDNILAEFDFWRYVRQIVGGAWLSYSGLGNPAGLAHLSELFRLPILGILVAVLPANLVRYVFIFGMVLVGSIGMYVYLRTVWLAHMDAVQRRWVASIGAILYVLHLLTIQQFYIAFEIFTVHFAYLPFLLLSIHYLAENNRVKGLFVFAVVQLLIAPSGHTPTVFYVGALFSFLYAASVVWSRGFLYTAKFVALVVGLTLFLNSYWILPNINYAMDGSNAVKESRENNLFGPEALWSVHDAATIQNFLRGTHYLFDWKQYSFLDKAYEPILGVWNKHVAKIPISLLAQLIGVLTLVGGGVVLINKKMGSIRWPILVTYAGCVLLIWMGFFPPQLLIDKITSSKFLLETFRNPFTKFSILYSFVSILFFVSAIEWIVHRFGHVFRDRRFFVLCGSIVALICIVSFPSFQGNYLNPGLRVVFPSVYKDMFAYLRTRSPHLRTLQLPQYEYVGWEYYDWTSIRPGNGYSGMGFYQFGMPQPFLLRDSDRWGEASDYFGHELKYALDNSDPIQFSSILQKYNIDLVIVDESKMDPFQARDYRHDHELLQQSNLSKVWQKDFITIYERYSPQSDSPIYFPPQVDTVQTDARRARIDTAYEREGDYISGGDMSQATQYPFADLTKRQLDNVVMDGDTVTTTRKLPRHTYSLSFPAPRFLQYTTPIKVSNKNQVVHIEFPQNKLILGKEEYKLYDIQNIQFQVSQSGEVWVFVNGFLFSIRPDEEIYTLFTFHYPEDVSISYQYPPKLDEQGISPDIPELVEVSKQKLAWENVVSEYTIISPEIDAITFSSTFPSRLIDPATNPTVNCSENHKGTIMSPTTQNTHIYIADGFGVNCNGFRLSEYTDSPPYLLRIMGQNILGRGLKMFINYKNPLSQSDNYLFTERSFDRIISLPYLASTGSSYINFNWETRSFGKQSIAQIDMMRLYTFPTNTLAMLKARPIPAKETQVNNVASVTSESTYVLFDRVTYTCSSVPCYVGFDESYNTWWLALDSVSLKPLPHFSYNSWSNIWKLEKASGQYYIVYIPRILSLICAVMVCFVVLVFALFFTIAVRTRKPLRKSSMNI